MDIHSALNIVNFKITKSQWYSCIGIKYHFSKPFTRGRELLCEHLMSNKFGNKRMVDPSSFQTYQELLVYIVETRIGVGVLWVFFSWSWESVQSTFGEASSVKLKLKDVLLKYISWLRAFKKGRFILLGFKEGCRWNNITGDLKDMVSKAAKKLRKHIYTGWLMSFQGSFHCLTSRRQAI